MYKCNYLLYITTMEIFIDRFMELNNSYHLLKLDQMIQLLTAYGKFKSYLFNLSDSCIKNNWSKTLNTVILLTPNCYRSKSLAPYHLLCFGNESRINNWNKPGQHSGLSTPFFFQQRRGEGVNIKKHTLMFPRSPAWWLGSRKPPCCLDVGLKWRPTFRHWSPSSKPSWTWKPCNPASRPWTTPRILTGPLEDACSKVSFPLTPLPRIFTEARRAISTDLPQPCPIP